MPSAYIDDAYTITATLPATSLYDSVRVVYRPLLPAETRRVALKIGNAESDARGKLTENGINQGERISAEVLAKQLVEWNVTDRGGHAVDITADTVQRLHGSLLAQLFSLVMGLSMPEPEAEQTSKN